VSRTVALAAVLLVTVGAARAEEKPERDPMRPFGAVTVNGGAARTVDGPRFAVTSVLIAPTRRIAVVNGKPLQLGDVVDGAEIVAIEPGTVRLRENGTELVLSLSRRASVREPIVQGDTVP
jgi:hypothetical protein